MRTRTPDAPTDRCAAQGYTVCGRVTWDGKPVAGVVTEAKFGVQHRQVRTDDEGYYGMKLQISVANLQCVESEAILDSDRMCQAEGSGGGPTSIDSDGPGQIVNFTVVPL